jgi:hypothetical protein
VAPSVSCSRRRPPSWRRAGQHQTNLAKLNEAGTLVSDAINVREIAVMRSLLRVRRKPLGPVACRSPGAPI